MDSNMEWMLSFIPTIIGTIVLITALMGMNTPLLTGILKVISLSSAPANFFRNQFEMFKYLSGPQG